MNFPGFSLQLLFPESSRRAELSLMHPAGPQSAPCQAGLTLEQGRPMLGLHRNVRL